ncbi:MAG: glycogen/starch synthase [Synergistaceae bacterium]
MIEYNPNFALKVLHVSPECSPLAKRGGLGDVVGSLPKALNEQSLDARVLMPAWSGVLETARKMNVLNEVPLGQISIALNWRAWTATVYEAVIDGVTIYLLDQPELFYNPDIYPEDPEEDDALPFIFLSFASFELPKVAKWKPQFIHAHDWSVAAIPAALKWHKYYSKFSTDYDTLFTIHNIAHQGLFQQSVLHGWGFDDEAFSTFNTETMEFYGQVNLMKGAIIACEGLTTVSPRYSWDIQLEEYGFGLDGVITTYRDKLHGILNGIDYDVWNPKTDKMIVSNYSKTNLRGKQVCREELLKMCKWKEDGRPILIFVGRLVEQKGIDIMLEVLESFIPDKVRVVIIGSGSDMYNRKVSSFENENTSSVFSVQEFNEKAAHTAYAGGDILLMPSAFEPCGLSQLIAFKYGTIPVARATGGLADTVIDADTSQDGTGFIFSDFATEELSMALERALNAKKDAKRWSNIIKNAMSSDFSWDKSAKDYINVYNSILTSD